MEKNQLLGTRSLVFCSFFTALITIGAFIKIPVPFMDYFTLQFLFVLLAGILLGSKLGACAVSVYVFMGLLGMPVFAAGGGIYYILKPSFGYLIGFIGTAFLVGHLVEKKPLHSFLGYFGISLLGMLVTYTIGFFYKYCILNFYLQQPTPFLLILFSAFPLDIPGDTVLCFLSALLAVKIRNHSRIFGIS